MEYLEGDTSWRKASSFLKGIVGGLWIGAVAGMMIWSFYLVVIQKADISGEESIALVLGAILGAPIGAIMGAYFSYLKRNNKRWRIFFLIMFCLPLLQFVYGLLSRILYDLTI